MTGTPWETFKFGVFFGMGFIVAYGVLMLIIMLLNIILSGAAGHRLEMPR